MRPLDFAPLYRSAIGFDDVFRLLDRAASLESGQPTYPPFNIELTGENAYRVTLAVAGFARPDLAIKLDGTTLVVAGARKIKDDPGAFVHRGIASRTFERRFELADHVEVTGADLVDGLLHIDLIRNLPERLKPRQIAIGSGDVKPQIEAKAA